jgi:hypothetical protein
MSTTNFKTPPTYEFLDNRTTVGKQEEIILIFHAFLIHTLAITNITNIYS